MISLHHSILTPRSSCSHSWLFAIQFSPLTIYSSLCPYSLLFAPCLIILLLLLLFPFLIHILLLLLLRFLSLSLALALELDRALTFIITLTYVLLLLVRLRLLLLVLVLVLVLVIVLLILLLLLLLLLTLSLNRMMTCWPLGWWAPKGSKWSWRKRSGASGRCLLPKTDGVTVGVYATSAPCVLSLRHITGRASTSGRCSSRISSSSGKSRHALACFRFAIALALVVV